MGVGRRGRWVGVLMGCMIFMRYCIGRMWFYMSGEGQWELWLLWEVLDVLVTFRMGGSAGNKYPSRGSDLTEGNDHQ